MIVQGTIIITTADLGRWALAAAAAAVGFPVFVR